MKYVQAVATLVLVAVLLGVLIATFVAAIASETQKEDLFALLEIVFSWQVVFTAFAAGAAGTFRGAIDARLRK